MTLPYEDGNPNAPICLIGEAPSFLEMKMGKPFVGPAGQLLEKCLHAAKILRRDTYIINVFETQVIKKKEKPEIFDEWGNVLWTPGKGFTEIGKDRSKNALAKIRACGANVLVPLGGVALHMCIRQFHKETPQNPITSSFTEPQDVEDKFEKKSISKWRGSIFYGIDNRKIVPTYHPSFALKGQYEGRYYIVSDLRKAKAESTHPQFIPTPRKLIIDPSFETCVHFMKRCLQAPIVDTDIEVLGGQMDCFSLSTSPNEAISIPLLDAGFNHRWSEAEERQILELYARILGSQHIAKVNQNIAFDIATLIQLNKIVTRGVVHDPMVAFSVMNPFLDKGLGVICSMTTREPYYKDDGTLKDSPTVADFAKRWEYNAKDAAIALEAWNVLEKDLTEENYWETYNLHMGEIPAIVYMMVSGLLINEKELEITKKIARTELQETIAKLSIAMGRPVIVKAPKNVKEKREAAATNAINVNSPAQLKQYFYADKGIKPYTNPGGVPTTDDKALAQLIRRYSLPEAKLMQEYRAQSKMLNTYLEMGYDGDRRLRCSYNIRGTWTGRLSSSQTIFETGGNFQNIPPEMRGFLVSDEVTA